MSGDVTAAIERLRVAMREAKRHEKAYKFSLLDEGSWPKDMRELRRASKALLAEVERLRAEREAMAMQWRVIRGAQVDMLNGRPDFDAMEEVAGASAEIDGLLTADPEADQ